MTTAARQRRMRPRSPRTSAVHQPLLPLVARVPLLAPLTETQEYVALLVAARLTMRQIAAELGVARSTVRSHVEDVAAKIPGDLSAMVRVLLWARGGTLDVLTGEGFRRRLHEATGAETEPAHATEARPRKAGGVRAEPA